MPPKQPGAIRAQSLNPQLKLRLPDFLREQKMPLPSVEEMRELHACLEAWSKSLVCLRLSFADEHGQGEAPSELLWVYLPEAVERHIADAWQRSPTQGHLLHSLAQQLCRKAVGLVLPEAGVSGCAPLPGLTRAKTDLLRRFVAGFEHGGGAENKFVSSSAGLGRVYSILTYYPYAGDCARCALSESCPRLRHC